MSGLSIVPSSSASCEVDVATVSIVTGDPSAGLVYFLKSTEYVDEGCVMIPQSVIVTPLGKREA